MVAIITGASSGIGRATALEFARQGISVVVAARQEQALEELAQKCTRLGAEALAVPTDVSNEDEVNALANRALAHFGHIDIWVNNAAVSLFGKFEEIPTNDIRQLMEVNVLGYIYGARTPLRHFRDRNVGLLINVSSMTALVGQPFSVPYSISKFAVRGLSLSLSQEVADKPNIHVSCVLPAVIDTPIFQHAANYMGKNVKAPEPVIPATDVAKEIFKLTQSPKEEIAVGNMARMLRAQRLVMPAGMFDKRIQKMIWQNHFNNENTPSRQGNLCQPDGHHNRIDGGWQAQSKNKSNSQQKKQGSTFNVVSGFATLFLVGGILGAAWINNKINSTVPATI
ncbi:SDR family oxidoreductase [Adhaeribacter pallidiroseus]|uniref:3-oxoacyl-[acyl-carrier-protein] reductase n=1 Tax=Adhaeribacter pallidiroseus TaxID=2072847 RepID=A0A369QCM9_9BACT|nr:SDR family oxidoreductase [Adhaeribacter pallidiroseus]RDC62651.1 3-oxoacyl-[acyl-carrier-protein] reductase [Adhaeribacter pallidiroseus]